MNAVPAVVLAGALTAKCVAAPGLLVRLMFVLKAPAVAETL